MTEAPVLVEVAGGVARVTLNRPAVRNALNAAMLSDDAREGIAIAASFEKRAPRWTGR